jgi:hypothetical protein
MPVFDFYQFIGIIAPGSLLLVMAAAMFDETQATALLAPENFGSLAIHLILAYIVGQLLQVVGNIIETTYWWAWGGLPTMWPITRPQRRDFPKAVEVVCGAAGQGRPKGNSKDAVKDWKRLLAQVRTSIYVSKRASRLEVFNAKYGLMRGVLAAVFVAAIVMAFRYRPPEAYYVYGSLLLIAVLAAWRMHRFSLNYALEFFANAAELARIGGKENASGD